MNTSQRARHANSAVFAGTLFVLACCVWQPSAARAQWVTSGTNINNTNTGNVGVGTTTPGEKLTVSGGNVYAGGASMWTTGSVRVVNTNAAGGWRFAACDNVGDVNCPVNGFVIHQDTIATRMAFAPGGNVGIGTSNPLGPVQIGSYTTINNPSAPTHSQFINNAFVSGGWRYMNSDAASALQIKDGLSYLTAPTGSAGSPLTWNERLRIDNAGNVGIGTSAPAHKLDVSGNMTIGSGYTSVTSVPVDGLVVQGNVGIGTASPFGQLEVKSAPGAHNSLSLNTTTAGYADTINFQEAGTVKASIQHNPSVLGGALLFNTSGGASPANTKMVIDNVGNVGIGTTTPASKLHVAGNITVDGNINAKYQDVAEWVPTVQKLQAGTVVVLDPQRPNHVLASTASYDTAVAGVISEKPGLALGEAGEGRVLVATTGRVNVKVDATRAPIHIGDLLVTSDVAGVAMRSEPVVLGGRRMHAPGTIIGKALEPLAGGRGEILVLLSLQ